MSLEFELYVVDSSQRLSRNEMSLTKSLKEQFREGAKRVSKKFPSIVIFYADTSKIDPTLREIYPNFLSGEKLEEIEVELDSILLYHVSPYEGEQRQFWPHSQINIDPYTKKIVYGKTFPVVEGGKRLLSTKRSAIIEGKLSGLLYRLNLS